MGVYSNPVLAMEKENEFNEKLEADLGLVRLPYFEDKLFLRIPNDKKDFTITEGSVIILDNYATACQCAEAQCYY